MAPLHHLLITGKPIVLQKVYISDIQNPKTVSNYTECRWQLFSLDKDNITQRSQMELSAKIKTFFQFFSTFLNSKLNLEHFRKNPDPHN